jgi:hypothetical protein
VPELGMLGSERGVLSNERPYRHHVVFWPSVAKGSHMSPSPLRCQLRYILCAQDPRGDG